MFSGWPGPPTGTSAPTTSSTSRGFRVDAVEWLLEHRDITGIGVDTLSLDFGPSLTFDVHHLLLGADRYGLENLANLSAIPGRGGHGLRGPDPPGGGVGWSLPGDRPLVARQTPGGLAVRIERRGSCGDAPSP
ncbi:MAG TPA: hypothetical protein VNO34_02085 [Actinomycetota bacterium]|nr:hypothetical protein [Actinomycetota bacterium]